MEIPNTYLFTAYYDLGNDEVGTYEQGALDRSTQNDKKNAFFDIQYEPVMPLEQLYAFRLTRAEGAVGVPDDAPQTIAVNLRTGLFEVDGRVFSLQHELIDECVPIEYRLLYYRNPAPFQTISKDPAVATVHGYSIGYVLGWQATVKIKGKERNIKRFISLPGVPVIVE